jgi:hypothetical protein
MSVSWTKTTLPGGEVVSIRRLGLFEIDSVEKNIMGPYTYTLKLGQGKEYEVPFDLSEKREEPKTPLNKVKEGTQVYYEWQEYLRYKEALAHHNKQLESYAAYCEKVFDYIKDTCLKVDDYKVLTDEDWEVIYKMVLNPFVSIEEITAAMRDNFRS